MKNADNSHWLDFIGWCLSGALGVLVTFPISSLFFSLGVNAILGDMILLKGVWHITEDYLMIYSFIPLLGTAVGVMQSLILRQKLSKMGWWVLTTTIGWSLVWFGFAQRISPTGSFDLPSSIEFPLASGAMIGMLIGAAQWLLLKEKLPHPGLWIPANALGFGIAGVIFWNVNRFYLDLMVAVTIPCFVTGIVLWGQFRKLHQSEAPA